MMMTTTTTYSDFIDNAITMNRNDHEQISVYLENFTRCSNQYSHKTFRILPYCLFVYLAPLLVVLVNFAYLSQVSIIPRVIPTPHSVILSYLPNGVPIPPLHQAGSLTLSHSKPTVWGIAQESPHLRLCYMCQRLLSNSHTCVFGTFEYQVTTVKTNSSHQY